MISLRLSPRTLPLVGYFSCNQAPSTCVCLEKYLRNLGLENILLFVSVVITAVKH